jgi:hypothetical protein
MVTFGKPAKVSEGVKPADVDGHLVVIRPIKVVDVVTKYGEATAIDVDLIDIDEERSYEGCRWFGKLLVATMRDQIDQLLIGTVGRGTARNGQSPPWVIEDQSENPTAVARATRVLQRFPDFLDEVGAADNPNQSQLDF